MRILVCLLISVAIIGGFLAHRHKDEPVATATPARHENNPHNWMKNSLDRTGEVKRQVVQQRKENSADGF